MEHPKRIGDRTTLAVMLAFAAQGYDVAVPFGENTRYDLIVDRGGVLSRTQCKTGRLRDGTIRFATSSTYGHLPSPRDIRRDYMGQIDEFAVYCPETRGVYVVPIGQLRTRTGHTCVSTERGTAGREVSAWLASSTWRQSGSRTPRTRWRSSQCCRLNLLTRSR